MNGSSELLVKVVRGPYSESTHRVSACVVTADGCVLLAHGDVERAYPIRSLAKPFIAAELVSSGACEAFGLGNVEIALAAGSHDGEPKHVHAVRRFLAKIGASEGALLCGHAMEGTLEVGPPVQNNCSGKHTAILAMCRMFGFSDENYIAPNHPIQAFLVPRLMDAFLETSATSPVAIDGCSMPIFGASLRQVAAAYATFGAINNHIYERVRLAMTTEAVYVGGTFKNIDTQLLSWSNGAILAKIGAEGLHADAVVSKRLGIALKVSDGNSRALPAVLAYLLAKHAVLSESRIAELARRAVVNASDRVTGEIIMVRENV